MIAVIDYGIGNVRSILSAFENQGANVFLTRDKNKILESDGVILPGVGAFAKAMHVLNNMGLSEGFEGSPLNNLTAKPNPGPNDVILVFFYADWCPHCVSAKPEFAKVVAKMNNTQVNGKNVKVQACNCEGSEVEKATASDNNIEGFPTIKLLTNTNAIDYNGARDAAGMETFVSENCGN